MKKLSYTFSVLLMFMLIGCAATDPYAIDEKASLRASWEIGEVVAQSSINFNNRNNNLLNRKFLGVTKEGGYYLVQDFYAETDQPATLPYKILDKNHVNERSFIKYANCDVSIGSYHSGRLFYSGMLTILYPDGMKAGEMNYWGGVQSGGATHWHANGSKKFQIFPASGNQKAFYLCWDEDGKLIDSGSPSNW